MKNIFLLIFIVLSSICYGETKADLEKEAQEKLDSAWDHLGFSTLGMAYGALELCRGNPIAASVAIGAAIREVKELISDFSEACDLSDRARGMDPESWGNREYDRDSRDNNYDRD